MPEKVYQVEIKKDEKKEKFNWRDTRFLALCLLLFLNVVMDTSIGYFAKPFFASELHSASGAAICISIINGGMLPAKYFASRVRKRKREMIFITFLGLAGATLLMAAVRGAVTSLIWCLVCGIFLGPQYSTIQGLAVDISPSFGQGFHAAAPLQRCGQRAGNCRDGRAFRLHGRGQCVLSAGGGCAAFGSSGLSIYEG